MSFVEINPLRGFDKTTSTAPNSNLKGRLFEDVNGKLYRLVQNKDGSSLSGGDVVKIDTSNAVLYEVVKHGGGVEKAYGVVVASSLADKDWGFVQVGGVDDVTVNDSAAVGEVVHPATATGDAGQAAAKNLTGSFTTGLRDTIFGEVLASATASGKKATVHLRHLL